MRHKGLTNSEAHSAETSAASDALRTLARLLARQAARDLVVRPETLPVENIDTPTEGDEHEDDPAV